METLFWVRVNEIISEQHKDEKDKTKFMRKLAKLLYISERTMYRIIKENREMSSEDKLKISDLLGISLERLLQVDTDAMRKTVNELIKSAHEIEGADSVSLFEEALSVALSRQQISLGPTERFEATLDVGLVYYEMRNFRAANVEWMDAWRIANALENSEFIFNACNNLMHAALALKRFGDFEKVIIDSEKYMIGDGERLGRMQYFLGEIAFRTKDYEGALAHYKKSHRYYLETEKVELISTALNNIGMVYLKTKSYELSKNLFAQAIDLVEGSKTLNAYFFKESYAESLIALGENEEAKLTIDDCLERLSISNDPNKRHLFCRFMRLKSIVFKTNTYAEDALGICTDEDIALTLREFLLDFFLRKGDLVKALYYHESVQKLRNGN